MTLSNLPSWNKKSFDGLRKSRVVISAVDYRLLQRDANSIIRGIIVARTSSIMQTMVSLSTHGLQIYQRMGKGEKNTPRCTHCASLVRAIGHHCSRAIRGASSDLVKPKTLQGAHH